MQTSPVVRPPSATSSYDPGSPSQPISDRKRGLGPWRWLAIIVGLAFAPIIVLVDGYLMWFLPLTYTNPTGTYQTTFAEAHELANSALVQAYVALHPSYQQTVASINNLWDAALAIFVVGLVAIVGGILALALPRERHVKS